MSGPKKIFALALLIGLYAAIPVLLFVAGVGILLTVMYLGRFLLNQDNSDLLKSAASALGSMVSGYVAWRIAKWLRS